MTKPNNGGPAFPPTHDPKTHDSGMTLRDYFAGQALVAFIQSRDMNGEDTAETAYAFADAMLRAREE